MNKARVFEAFRSENGTERSNAYTLSLWDYTTSGLIRLQSLLWEAIAREIS